MWRITKERFISKSTKEHCAAGKILRSFGFSVCDKMRSIQRERFISLPCVKKKIFFVRFLFCLFWKCWFWFYNCDCICDCDKRWTVLFWFFFYQDSLSESIWWIIVFCCTRNNTNLCIETNFRECFAASKFKI